MNNNYNYIYIYLFFFFFHCVLYLLLLLYTYYIYNKTKCTYTSVQDHLTIHCLTSLTQTIRRTYNVSHAKLK